MARVPETPIIPDEVNDPEGYARALCELPRTPDAGQARDRIDRHWNSSGPLRRFGYFVMASAFLVGTGAAIHGTVSASGNVRPAGPTQTCVALPGSYEVPAAVAQELFSAKTQVAGWTALQHDMRVPQGGAFGEIAFTVSGLGSEVSDDIASLDQVIATENETNGVLGTVNLDSSSARVRLTVDSAEYCVPQQ